MCRSLRFSGRKVGSSAHSVLTLAIAEVELTFSGDYISVRVSYPANRTGFFEAGLHKYFHLSGETTMNSLMKRFGATMAIGFLLTPAAFAAVKSN